MSCSRRAATIQQQMHKAAYLFGHQLACTGAVDAKDHPSELISESTAGLCRQRAGLAPVVIREGTLRHLGLHTQGKLSRATTPAESKSHAHLAALPAKVRAAEALHAWPMRSALSHLQCVQLTD